MTFKNSFYRFLVINVLITATYETGTTTANYGQSLLAVQAVGSTAYNLRVHVNNLPTTGTKYAISQGTAPTHWGNYYPSDDNGQVNSWYGTKVARDLGGQCLEGTKSGGDNSAKT